MIVAVSKYILPSHSRASQDMRKLSKESAITFKKLTTMHTGNVYVNFLFKLWQNTGGKFWHAFTYEMFGITSYHQLNLQNLLYIPPEYL